MRVSAITNIYSFPEHCVADFAKVCSLGHLTSLNLAESSKLTDDGLGAIASLSQLRKLNLASCMNITHQGIKNLSK